MKRSRQICKKYFRRVKAALPDGASKKGTLLHIKYDIEGYAAEHPDLEYDDLVTAFGTPDRILDGTLSLEPAQNIRKRAQGNRRIALAIAALLFLFTGVLSVNIVHYYDSCPSGGYITIDDAGVEN